ncbi:MAG: PBSX family phage terminase large subunit [Firmicutes bacterium]|nr:PBSX family phage terminase large subunit [Bacillota bacterium]
MQINKAYVEYLNKAQPTQIFFGGSSSGKSYFIAQKIVLDNLKGVNWLCCRNVARTMRNSIYNQIVKTIGDMGLNKAYRISKSDMVITCRRNGAQILFSGLDDEEKVKSITPAKGVLERIFVEEATEIRESAYMQLKKRLRGISKHAKYIVLAFNPILKSHWIYKKFFGKWSDDLTQYEDNEVCILKTTYKDNAMLTRRDREQLENETDEYFYNVYTLGLWGVLGHIIFKNWKVADLSAERATFDHIYMGCDFGFSDDPNALIKVHHDRKNRRLYILDEHYQAGMNDMELERVARAFTGGGYIVCDCEDAKTIDYLASVGIRAVPARKGPDSINRGIRWLQGYEIIIDTQCQNFKNEIEQYHWLEDKYGNAMAKACDKDNHLIDALRYATEELQIESNATAGVRI